MRQFLYDCSISMAQVGLRVAAIFQPKTKRWLNSQKGLIPKIVAESKGLNEPVWVHCASLGEFEQGRPLIEKIKELHPSKDIVLTFFSPSGFEIRKDYAGANRVFYLPLDSQSNAGSFLDALKPSLAIFVKYDVWPNYLSALKARDIPSVLISAKFTEDSLYFKTGGGFLRQALFKFDHIFVQDETSKSLLERADFKKVSVTGDTRIDRVIHSAQTAESNTIVSRFCGNGSVLVAGSTWWREEQLLFELIEQKPELKLVLAPHEIDATHLIKVSKLFGNLLIRFSDLEKGQEMGNERVLLIDNIGMLSSLYRFGLCAYIGGGFGDGIHNVLEAAVYGIPVVFGPNNKKFKEAHDLKKLGVAFEINSSEELKQAVSNAIDGQSTSDAKKILAEYFAKEKGATDKICAFLKSYL